MTRKEFIKFSETGKSAKPKQVVVNDNSVTDPTFAQTGRQMLTNPLAIEYRMKYPEGTPLNKENPMAFNEFDKIYPDTFKAIREANSLTDKTTKQLKELQNKKTKNNPQNQSQQ